MVAELPRALELRTELSQQVKAAGFRFATIDLGGIQSGAFTLPLVTRG